jgi:hypothetical protein
LEALAQFVRLGPDEIKGACSARMAENIIKMDEAIQVKKR